MKKASLILLAALLAGTVVWIARRGGAAPAEHPVPTEREPRVIPAAGQPPGAEAPPVTDRVPPGEVPDWANGPPDEEGWIQEGAQQRRQRLEKLMARGRGWVRALERTLDLSAAQVESMEQETDSFAAELEAIWWRQGEEFDRETALAALYEKWDGRLAGHLSRLQREEFGGLPRDWGFGLTTPGPR